MHPPDHRWAARFAAGALTVALLPSVPSTASAAPVAAVVPAAAPAAVAGGRSAGDPLFPTIGNTGYDVSHYAIALTYASDSSITATTTIEAKAERRLSSFSLDLEGLLVDRVRVDGRDATHTRTGTKLVVTPAKPVAGSFVVAVRYHGRPSTHIDPDGSQDGWVPSRTGATALSEPVGSQTWFPNNNTPRDKAAYDIALTVPKGLAAASNGVLRSKKTVHGATTWRWRQRQPMATYLSLLAIGEFDVYRSTVKLRHGRKIPAWTFVDPTVGSTKEQRALLPKVLAFSEKQYGRYPFDATGMVIQDLGVGYALETQTRPFFDGPPDSSTLVHELAHQWFGDSVTPKDWGDIWLNEGFASYAEDSWAAEHGGPTTWASFRATYAANDASSDLWHPAPTGLTDGADLFGDSSYVRGRLTLEALRHKIGDKRTKTLLQTWAERYRSRSVTTSQFTALAEKVSGQDLDAFFKAWLEVPARPTVH